MENIIYAWIIIDDQKFILEKIASELSKAEEKHIYCLKPLRRKKIETWTNQLSFKPPLLPDDEEIVMPDYDYEVEQVQLKAQNMPDYDYEVEQVQPEAPTLTEILEKVYNDSKVEQKQPCFIFLIDILFERTDFCGCDLYKYVRTTLNPKWYVVKFLSHLSRKMVSEFLHEEFSDLQLGLEKSVSKVEEQQTPLKQRRKPFVSDKMDDGFFSKAPYRTEGLTILNKHRIKHLKDLFPRSCSLKDFLFGIY